MERTAHGVDLIDKDGARQSFDEVVFACHSDQALRLLADPSPSERRLLGAIPYQANRVLLHRDPAPDAARTAGLVFLELSQPLGRRRGPGGQRHLLDEQSAAPGDVERLLRQSESRWTSRARRAIAAEFEYEHPVFTTAALEAQKQLHRIQGRSHTWFAGAWTGYGFHEDGMRSGVEVAQALGATLPWDAGAGARLA